MIALVDVNNFYVSCERLFNPKLLNKPVVVLSNNDGCIISRSDEVKLLDARDSLEFVTAVYNSSRQGKNIHLPINKDNPLYNSWLPEK